MNISFKVSFGLLSVLLIFHGCMKNDYAEEETFEVLLITLFNSHIALADTSSGFELALIESKMCLDKTQDHYFLKQEILREISWLVNNKDIQTNILLEKITHSSTRLISNLVAPGNYVTANIAASYISRIQKHVYTIEK